MPPDFSQPCRPLVTHLGVHPLGERCVLKLCALGEHGSNSRAETGLQGEGGEEEDSEDGTGLSAGEPSRQEEAAKIERQEGKESFPIRDAEEIGRVKDGPEAWPS